jgi:hypothetical protein
MPRTGHGSAYPHPGRQPTPPTVRYRLTQLAFAPVPERDQGAGRGSPAIHSHPPVPEPTRPADQRIGRAQISSHLDDRRWHDHVPALTPEIHMSGRGLPRRLRPVRVCRVVGVHPARRRPHQCLPPVHETRRACLVEPGEPDPAVFTSTSTTSSPEAAPVGTPMFAPGHRRHHAATCRTSAVASWKPCSVSGRFSPGTHGKTGTPAVANTRAAPVNDCPSTTALQLR